MDNLTKEQAISFIDHKIDQFQTVKVKAEFKNRFDNRYMVAYFSTERLLNELFDENEGRNFIRNVRVYSDDTGDYTQQQLLDDYILHLDKCIEQLNMYRKKIESNWEYTD